MKRIFIFILALLLHSMTYAQGTLSFTLNQQPCNNDGILTTTVTGLTNPITITYYTTGTPIVHTITTGNTDVLNNYSGALMYVSALDVNQDDAFDSFSALPFTVSVNQWNTAICPNLASIPVTVSGGTAPYTYNWMDQNSITVSTSNPANLPGGYYDLVVTDNNGCTVSIDSGIMVYSQASFNVTVNTTQANCTNGTATATVSGTGGVAPYSYLWNTNATTNAINSLTMGGYSVTVTDAQGCSASGYGYVSQAITINPNVVATPATCIQTNGAVSSFPSGGVPPYSYLWNNMSTAQTQTNIAAGYYSVKVTDANGCIGNSATYVNSTTPINVTYNVTASSCTAPTGSATLSVSGGTAPYTINWNTFPAQTGTTASNLPPGNYSFTITDANSCVRTGSITIQPVNIITVSFTHTSPTCTQANGSISVSASGGASPYTYSWSNAATTSSITGVAAGGYSVTITDNAGCAITKSHYLAAYSPLSIGIASTPASCVYTSDGIITATPFGGTAPYTWNTTTGTNTMTGLATGNYYVGVTDANGCTAYQNANVPHNPSNNACYCTVTGTVYHDANNNCVKDAGENGIPNIQMHLNGFGYAYTDANGVYSFKAPNGSYSLSETVQTLYPLSGCQNNNISVNVTAASNCTQTFDFANTINPLHDVKITRWNNTMPIPGYNYSTIAIVSNEGTVAESNIVGGMDYDVQLTSPAISPSGIWVNGAGPQYNIASTVNFSLNPGVSQAFYMDKTIPTNMPLNTLLTIKDTVAHTAPMSNWLTDYTPFNNVQYFTQSVVGSYDPNFKEVIPAGEGPTGKIYAEDSVLEYMVHFQNLGTYQAFNIVVLDTLDADLDRTTLKPGYSSHPATISMDENGVLKYTFANINLPAKMYDEVASNGMFTYSIKTRKNLPVGTQFTNRAAIYFDFNEPVITNTTLNTLSAPTNTNEVTTKKQGSFSLYPNPANNICYVKLNVAQTGLNSTLKITDLTGKTINMKEIHLSKGEQVVELNTANLISGIYFVALQAEGGQSTQKLVIVK